MVPEPTPTPSESVVEELPFQDPANAAVLVDGRVVTLGVAVETSTGVATVDDGTTKMTLQIAAGDGLVVVPDANGRIRMHSNMEIAVQGEGFEPNSIVDVLLLPGDQKLGQVTTDGDGSFSASLGLPKDLALGVYNVKVNGMGIDGKPREMALGIEVVDDSEALDVMRPAADMSASGNNATGLLLSIVVLGCFFLIAARRRKKDDREYIDIFRFHALEDRGL